MGANAQTTVPTFTLGQVLTADQQNQSARTGVPVFASTVTRDAGFGGTGEKTLAEGQLCYVEGTGLQTYNGSTWITWGTSPAVSGVVQVKSTTKTDTFTTTSTSFTDVTGLSVSITPTSASNKILVILDMNGSQQVGTNACFARLMRDSTAIAIGDAAGSRVRSTFALISSDAGDFFLDNAGMNFLDSPATTSALTYKAQVIAATSGTVYVNRTGNDGDSTSGVRAVSSITVMEVAP